MNQCPYCLESVDQPEEAAACRACGALYHPECWAENGGCCAKGCESVKSVVELDISADRCFGNSVPETPGIVITSEEAQKAVAHTAERKWNPCLGCGRHIPKDRLYCPECVPDREPGQDARNAGPLLLVFLLALLVLGAIVILGNLQGDKPEQPGAPGIETIFKR